MTRQSFEHYRGEPVEFFVRDIYLPDPAAILAELHDGDRLKGKVLDLSDDARDDGSAFLVVEVEGLRDPCIVAVERIQPPEKK
jgi:hypothetical protein